MSEPIYGAAFPSPFSGESKPTPDEVAGLSTEQAIISGVNKGLDSKQLFQAQTEMESVGNLLDGFMERLALALEEELSAAQAINAEMDRKAITVIVDTLLPAVETSIALAGFQPAGAPGQGKGGKSPRRRRQPAQPVTAPHTEPMPAEPPSTGGCHDPAAPAHSGACTDGSMGQPIAFVGGAPSVKAGDTFTATSPVLGRVEIRVESVYENQATGRDTQSGVCYAFNVTGCDSGIAPPPAPPPARLPPAPLPPVAPPPPAPPPPSPPGGCAKVEICNWPDFTVNVNLPEAKPPASPPPPSAPPDKCEGFWDKWGVEKPEPRDPLPPCIDADIQAAYGATWNRLIQAGANSEDVVSAFTECGLCEGQSIEDEFFNLPDPPCEVNPYEEGGLFSAYGRWNSGYNSYKRGVDPTPFWTPAQREGYFAAKACGEKYGGSAITPEAQRASCPTIPGVPTDIPNDLSACLTGGARAFEVLIESAQAWVKNTCEGGIWSTSDWLLKQADEWGKVPFIGPVLKDLAQQGSGVIRCLACNAVSVEEWAGQLMGCPGAPILGPLLIEAAAGIYERWVGEIPEKVKDASRSLEGWICPRELPSLPEATEAYLRAGISDSLWECLARADGQRPDMARLIRDSRRRTITPEEALILKRRGMLPQDRYEWLVSREGFARSEDAAEWEQTQQWLPEPTEAVEWMLKDLGDPQISDRFGLWNEFKLKYRGHVKEVMDWHGIKEQDARHIAAAHLQSVAPTQLYEMHKRLRPGFERRLSDTQAVEFALAISPQRPVSAGAEDEIASIDEWQASEMYQATKYPGTPEWESLGYPPKPPYWRDELTTPLLARAYLANLVTTGGIVYEGLSQARYPTFWRERLEAISYRVLTRTDARRAYEVGQITAPELGEILQDQGYTSVDADRLVAFYVESLIQKFAGSVVANQWVKEGFSIDKLFSSLTDKGMRREMFAEVLPRLERRRALEIERECLKAVKRRFLAGYIDTNGATAQLNSIGLGVERIDDVLREWGCLKRARPRAETARQVTSELISETITTDSAKRILRDAGYTAPQAARIIRAAVATAATPGKVRQAIAGKLLAGIDAEG